MSLAEDNIPSPHMRVRRRYTQSALETWFRRMVNDWEFAFTREELDMGRDLYLEDSIREVEITEKDAIIKARGQSGDCYVVIEWPQKFPLARASVDDLVFGRAVAVAGLYEIEELLADEIPPIPLGPEEAQKVKQLEETNANESAIFSKDSAGSSAARDRKLYLHFSSGEAGLIFEAYWNVDSIELIPAFGPDSDPEPSGEEREMLIRLTGLAKRSGFSYRNNEEAFVLQDPTRAIPFLRESLPGWEDHFEIELDEEAELLRDGSREVELVADLSFRHGSDEISVSWKFKDDSDWLGDEDGERLRKAGSRGIIIPGRGALRLRSEQTLAIKDWERFLKDYHGDGVPAYLAFSVFFSKNLQVMLPDNLTQWKEKVSSQLVALEDNQKTESSRLSFLRTYQMVGVQWMQRIHEAGCHALLADEMGLGKTVQVLSLICAQKPLKGPSLVVCPASVIPVWQAEIARFFPEMSFEILGRGNSPKSKDKGSVIWLASYHQLRRMRTTASTIQWQYLILDEAQYIKNPSAKISQACFALKAKRRLALTGTPLENRCSDLWSLFHFLMPGMLGDRQLFDRLYDEGGEQFFQDLQRQIRPFILRRTKNTVVKELPSKNEFVLHCPLTELQKEEYDRLFQQGIVRMGSDIETAMRSEPLGFLTLLTRLRQTCCDARLLPWVSSGSAPGGKILALLEKMEELIASGHKVVIFSQFTRLLDCVRMSLHETFPTLPLFQLTGKTVDREKPVYEFQENEGSAAILVSLRAGGTGITLHSADYVFLMDPWWNPAVEQQAVDRVHRIGQENPVFVYRMIAEGSIESRIQRLQLGKKELFRRLISKDDNRETEDSLIKDLKALIQLEE